MPQNTFWHNEIRGSCSTALSAAACLPALGPKAACYQRDARSVQTCYDCYMN